MGITEATPHKASPSHRRLSFSCTVNEELSASVPRLAYVELYWAMWEYSFELSCLVVSELHEEITNQTNFANHYSVGI